MSLFLAAALATAPTANAQSFEPPTLCDQYPSLCPPELQLKPELSVRSISAGCTGPAGDPTIVVTVENTGDLSATAWVDLWFGLASPPSVGDWGQDFKEVTVAAGSFRPVTFLLDEPAGASGWIDIIVDTVEAVSEYDETNNHSDQHVTIPDCYLN